MHVLRVVLALSATLLAARTDATSCELLKIFTIVQPLESNADVAACVAATGFEMLPPSGPPTDAQIAKLCATGACTASLHALETMDIPDCTIDMLGGLNIKQVFDGVRANCSSIGATSDVASSAASSTPAPTEASLSTTPTVTTAKTTIQATQPLVTAAPAQQPQAGAQPSSGATTGASPAAGATREPTLAPKLCV